ncbi:unnamed protein product, partial [Ixodes persulcatus]
REQHGDQATRKNVPHRRPSCQLEVPQATLRTVRDSDRSKEQVRRTKGCTAADSSGIRRHRRVQHVGLRRADSDRFGTGKSAQRCGGEVRQQVRAQKKRSARPIPTAMPEAKAGEAFDAFLTDLKAKAKDCNYEGQRDKMIRDQVIFGINNEEVRMKLLKLEDPTLETVAKVCLVHETSANQLKAFKQDPSMTKQETDPLHAMKTTKPKQHAVKL